MTEPEKKGGVTLATLTAHIGVDADAAMRAFDRTEIAMAKLEVTILTAKSTRLARYAAYLERQGVSNKAIREGREKFLLRDSDLDVEPREPVNKQ